MIDMEALEAAGYTQESLKRKFEKDPLEGKCKDLADLVYSHIKDGVVYNIKQSRLYYALDLAWNAPFKQITPTLLHSIKGKPLDDESVKNAVADWGASWLVDEINSLKGENPKKLNIPEFWHIFVPLVRSYVTVRWARIVNDRRLVPFMKYDPVKNSKKNRTQCEVITDRVERTSVGYDYQSIFQHATFHTLHYGECIMFPRESWHTVEQGRGKDAKPAIVKEGIRYHIPHPTRKFYDLNYPAYTINTGTGVAHGGYWGINKWGDVQACKDYYNLDKVSYGGVDWLTGATGWTNFLATVMGGTALNFPTPSSLTQDINVQQDRETQASLYSSNEHDKAVVISEVFELINPKQWGLYDYDFKVWHRFVVANASTILYCEPLPYNPMIYFGYDATGNHAIHSSLSLEVLPFQDHFGNLLSQYILAVKQNLANITFVDETRDKTLLDRLKGMGRRLYETLNFEAFDARQDRITQKEVKDVFQSFSFPKSNTQEIAGAMRELLDILERVLVLSSQEVGAAGSHEQTAEEIRNIANFTSNRLQFTANAFDRGMSAWKQQLYEGLMAYGEEELYATLQNPASKKELEDMGFTVEDHDANGRIGYAVVKIGKTAIQLDQFAANRDTSDRTNNTAGASVMNQALQAALANPMTAAAIGAEQAIELMNYVGEMAGVPRDFRLKISTQYAEYEKLQKEAAKSQADAAKVGPMMEQLQQQMGQALQQLQAQTQEQLAAVSAQIQQLAEGTTQVIQEQVQPAIAQVAQVSQQAVEASVANAQGLQQQAEILDQLSAAVAAVSTLVSQPQQPMPPEAAPVGM